MLGERNYGACAGVVGRESRSLHREKKLKKRKEKTTQWIKEIATMSTHRVLEPESTESGGKDELDKERQQRGRERRRRRRRRFQTPSSSVGHKSRPDPPDLVHFKNP